MKEWRKHFNKTFFSLFKTNSEMMSKNPTFAEIAGLRIMSGLSVAYSA